MGHRITHPFEFTRYSRFYLAGALRDTESLLYQQMMSRPSSRSPLAGQDRYQRKTRNTAKHNRSSG